MADIILGSAQGAVGSLLGRLASALGEEAKLLRGVRGDVQFIKDEMESMNGFLLHVAESTGDGEEDPRVRAWMKQVAEVAYSSQNCVDLYVQTRGTGAGTTSYFRRLPRLLWTLPTRHRIATQIRELKTRSREVGERRLRYGVEAPAPPPSRRNHVDGSNVGKAASRQASGDDDAKERDDARRRELANAHAVAFESFKLVEWMKEGGDQPREGWHQHSTPRVIALWGSNDRATTHFAETAYKDPWVKTSCCLDCMAWVKLGPEYDPGRRTALLRDILEKLAPPAPAGDQRRMFADGTEELNLNNEQLIVQKLKQHLRAKKFLLVLHVHAEEKFLGVWDGIKAAFSGNCAPGSAVLVLTKSYEVASSVTPKTYSVLRVRSDRHEYLTDFYLEKATALVNSNDMKPVLRSILRKLSKEAPECIRLFLHALYVNPSKTLDDFQSLSSSNSKKKVQMLLYNGLSSNCKNCFLHLSIFPEKATIRRTRLVRRWVAEGMITKCGRLSSRDEADRCFDLLLAHGFLMPQDTDVTGKVKSCVVHDIVTEIASDEYFVNSNLPPDLAHRLSVRSAFNLQQAAQQLQMEQFKPRWNICIPFYQSKQTEADESYAYNRSSNQAQVDKSNDATRVFLESLPLSTSLGMLEVLDLEDCKELKGHHLKNICNHVFQLKYLSLRNTGINELPKQIDKLLYLETLDIRGTMVRAFARNSVVLPKLKHLLAGYKAQCTTQDGIHSDESFFTVQMPKHTGAMTELQVLHHVAVSESGSELIEIGNLLQLRKLGVVLQGTQGGILMHLYHAIGKLSRSLRTLSIQIIASTETNAQMGDLYIPEIPPKYLEKLEISGLSRLPPWTWIKHLRELTKVTLHKTHLAATDIEILGRLNLCYLWLKQDSYGETKLSFSNDEFQYLKFLVIECSDIVEVNFANEATPKLNKIVWYSTTRSPSPSISGIECLQSLKEVKLTGNFNLEVVQKAIEANKNNPILEIKQTHSAIAALN